MKARLLKARRLEAGLFEARHAAIAVSFFVAAWATVPAHAQTVYRCGNEYTSIPCPEGGRVVEATDPRSAAQRAEARRLAALERRQAEQMKKDRLAAEKAEHNPAMVSGFDSRASATPHDAASAPAKPKAKKKTKKDASQDGFTAVDPTTVGKRK